MPKSTVPAKTARKVAKTAAKKQTLASAKTAKRPSTQEDKEKVIDVKPEEVINPVAAKEKLRKPKLVRDSFTMPKEEYAILAEVKNNCIKAGIDVKKSELLRLGISLLRQFDTDRLKQLLEELPALKSGRPKKRK